MNYFKANFSCLSGLEIPFTPETDEAELEKSRSGAMTLKIKNTYIHSRFDPLRDSEKLVGCDDFNDASICIFYGFGLGYHIEIFTRLYPEKPFLIIEPDPDVFSLALQSRDMRELLGNPGLHFYINRNPEYISDFLSYLPLDNVKVFKLRAITEIYAEYFKRIDTYIQGFLTKKDINLNTVTRFGKLWIRNLLKNIDTFSRSPGVQVLENAFSSIPSLLLASGPTLNSILPHIRILSKKMLIISVDTSVNTLLRQGLEPDIILVFDPQYWNVRHLDRAQVINSILISETSTHPGVFKRLNIPCFMAGSFFPLGKFLEKLTGPRGRIGAGGSVATSAWDFARYIQALPVNIAGLDLGFPDFETHFKGAAFENNFLNAANRLIPSSHMSFQFLYQADPFKVKNYNGEDILTDKRLIIYKWWFEYQCRIHSDAATYNLSKKGIFIKEIPFRDVEALFNLPDKRDEINIIKKRIISEYHAYADNYQERKAGMLSALETLRAEIMHIRKLAENALKELSEYKKDKNNKRLKTIDDIEKKILKIQAREIISFLLQPLINKSEKSNTESLEDNLAFSEEIFNSILDSSRFHISEINKIK